MQSSTQPMLVAQPLDYESIDGRIILFARLLRRGVLLYAIGSLIGALGYISYAVVEWMTAAGWIVNSGFGPVSGVSYLLVRGAVFAGLYVGAIAFLSRRSTAATAFLRVAAVLHVAEGGFTILSYFVLQRSALPTGVLVQTALSVAGTVFFALAVWTLASPSLLYADRR